MRALPLIRWATLCIPLLASACSGDASSDRRPPSVSPQPVVGADRDEHGCKGSAGYRWSLVRNECIRIFEAGIRLNAKAPGLDTTFSAFVVFKSDTEDEQAELFLPGQEPLLLDRVADSGAGTWKRDTLVLTQWKGMYTLDGGKQQTLYQGAQLLP